MGRRFYPQARVALQVVLDGFGTTAQDTTPQVIPVLPRSLTVHKNSYRQADSWEIAFDAGDLPLDPSLIRAGAADIYLYQVEGVDDDRRLVDRREAVSLLAGDDSDRAGRVLLGGAGADIRPLVAGPFDRAGLELSSGGKWVTIAGQDYTALLAAKQWPPQAGGRARRIPTGDRLDVFLRKIIREAEPLGKLELALRGVEASQLPVVGVAETSGNRRGIPIEQDTSYWDVMYKVATRYGLVLHVDGLDVVLERPSALTKESAAGAKRLAWGRNLSELKLERELGREQVPAIVVTSYDPATRRTISVEWPEGEYTKVKRRTTKSGKETVRATSEYQIITAPAGIADQKILLTMAQTAHRLLGRAERRIIVATKDLRDLRGDDLLRLSSGDVCRVDWDEFNRELLANPALSLEAKVDHMVSRGFGRAVARVIAEHYVRLEGLRRPLRVREATYEYSVDQGVRIELELADFIVPEGTRQGPEARSQARAAEGGER